MSKSYRFPITGYDISFDLSKYYFFVFYISVSILQPIWGAWSDADVYAIRKSILSNTTYHRLIRPTENMTVNVSLSLLTVNFLVRSVGKDAWCDFSFDYLSYHASIIWNEILVYHQFSVWRLEHLDRLSFFSLNCLQPFPSFYVLPRFAAHYHKTLTWPRFKN